MSATKGHKVSRDVIQDANRVVGQLAERCSLRSGFGSLSISIYDTAWLAMIRAPGDRSRWLFPESYSYLLLHQAEDGTWPTYASPIDGILNTLAGLLALVKHHKSESVDADAPRPADGAWGLPSRIEKARGALASALSNWKVDQTVHVCFEMLVPSLLKQLGEEGIVFEFAGRSALTALQQKKLSRFQPDMVASKKPSSLLHSLEALVGTFDFGLVRHHCTDYGGMLGSPASTAAYLAHSPAWDARAQAYLEHVVRSYGSCGGVPSAFPTPLFEMSWVMSTLLSNGFDARHFRDEDVRAVTGYLREAVVGQGGVLGFAPALLPDADDSARCLLALTALGVQADRAPLVRSFEAGDHFRTYPRERDPSASANCNVLLALLASPDVDRYAAQIEKAARFLCARWAAGGLRDKWNLATEYADMLLASALGQLLHVYDGGRLRDVAVAVVQVDVPIVLVQLLGRTLCRQRSNGSWEDSVERTSYGALLLSHALKLPCPLAIRQQAEAALSKAKAYLASRSGEWASGEYLWIEKVTYKCPILSEAYCLAAMGSPAEKQAWTAEAERMFCIDESKSQNMSIFFGRLPLLRGLSNATMALAVAEAAMYVSRLKHARLDVFPRDNMGMSADKYLEYIPIAWTAINAANGFPLSGHEMWEMMVISMLNYQADEYMESVVASLGEPSLQALGSIIATEIRGGGPRSASPSPHRSPLTPPRSDCGSPSRSPALEDVAEALSRYIKHVMQHKAVLQSPASAQLRVTQEFEKFLLAHMAHNSDSARWREQQQQGSQAPVGKQGPMPYYDWVRTTGADDTSCPYSFAFFCCLISGSGPHCLASADQKYLAREMCLHLAVLCRQYNDHGSAARDDAEGNLNSLHFSEFTDRDEERPHTPVTSDVAGGGTGTSSLDTAKRLLMKMADIERACMQVCWEALSRSLDKDTRAKVKTFIDLTDLFGQIYVARDIASKIPK
ncbi:hypothetical protein CDD83_8805 [Cordyceps sp. RAO-2017]|nr:hypothetical protein CDD83_8805 [Cordyceps sp. RAO-2017]